MKLYWRYRTIPNEDDPTGRTALAVDQEYWLQGDGENVERNCRTITEQQFLIIRSRSKSPGRPTFEAETETWCYPVTAEEINGVLENTGYFATG